MAEPEGVCTIVLPGGNVDVSDGVKHVVEVDHNRHLDVIRFVRAVDGKEREMYFRAKDLDMFLLALRMI